MKTKNNKGMALVAAILMMVVIAVLGVAMVLLTSSETRKEVKSRMGGSALYIADAGIEKGIHRINAENYSSPFTVVIGTVTGEAVGEADVTVQPQGADLYKITSTGHVPDIASSREDRTIRAVVRIEPEQPEEAMRSVGPITVASNVDVVGSLRSNSWIKFNGGNHITEDENGTCSVITSTGTAKGVWMDGKVYWDGAGHYYIKSNGPTNASKGGDTDETGVYEESQISNGIVTVVENAGIEPIEAAEIPFYDLDLLKADAVAQDSVGHPTVFDAEKTYDTELNMAGKVHWYKNGVLFNKEILNSSGTILATGVHSDNTDYGISFKAANADIGDAGNFQKINLIVDNEAGEDKSINFNSNIYVQGYIYCPGDLSLPSNVHVRGVIEVGEDSDVSSNVEIIYDDIGYSLPGGGEGGVTVISWQEM
ncbi:MAG: pilus assembly PilX N-terminal domain-containing protein [Elusimicrobia bacterium]|jgi:hypothetical protein|nr:pilus assembly PilX N-terminal domain-containing protein [Elusimicrobiota bacterium]